MIASLRLLTPSAAIVGLAGILPLVALDTNMTVATQTSYASPRAKRMLTR